MAVLQIHHCILYNRRKHTKLLLDTNKEQFIQQIYFKPGSESRERLYFVTNLYGSIINSSPYIVQSE